MIDEITDSFIIPEALAKLQNVIPEVINRESSRQGGHGPPDEEGRRGGIAKDEGKKSKGVYFQ